MTMPVGRGCFWAVLFGLHFLLTMIVWAFCSPGLFNACLLPLALFGILLVLGADTWDDPKGT